jgi:hypothetical protein
MISSSSPGLRWPAPLAALIVCLTPWAARSETIVFRNECRSMVTVQTASVVRGVYRKDRAIHLRPGEASARIPLDADKLVIISDPRTNRPLYKDGIRSSKRAVYVGIVPDTVPFKVKLIARPPFPPGKGTGVMPGMTGPGH